MYRIYYVKETEYGTVIDGPNGHRWVCKPEDGENRIKGFAKALERAYSEGLKSLASDPDLSALIEDLEQADGNGYRKRPEKEPAEMARRVSAKIDRTLSLDRQIREPPHG